MTSQEFISLYQSNPKPISNDEKAGGKIMKPEDKAKELSNKYERIVEYSVEQCLIEMHDWTKNQFIEKAIKLMQHWILEHDYVDIMELEDYIKQKMEES